MNTYKRSFAAILITLMCSGCVTTRYQRVFCLTPQQLEKLKADKPGKIHDQLTGKADQDIRPITGRLVRMEGFADGLVTILGGCTGPTS
jgi:hypothetical protein